MDSRIIKIIEYAIMAPSGDNCQPWRFSVTGKQINLYNIPERDTSLYNLHQRASLVSHGAVLENIEICAPSFGLTADIRLLPDQTDPNLIATALLTECPTKNHELLDTISKRHTNREAYSSVEISNTQRKKLMTLGTQDGQEVWLSQTTAERKSLAKLLSYNERLVFEIHELHQFLFEHLRWTDEEAIKTGDGLDIKTLGLNSIDKYAFNFLKNWQFVNLLNKVGFSKIIEFKGRQLLNTASSVAILSITGSEPKDYVQGGQLWQRFLLHLAKEGLTAHPVAGLAFLLQSVKEGSLKNHLNNSQLQRLNAILNDLQQMTNSNDSTLLSMFRIGQGAEVTRALRKPVECFIVNH
ncbi:hypothetical protein SAMN02745165_02699 [Malonomonas rubra DSM 5091]|uniref:Nitroreductase family protein n=1 Tax=Malonomonas rubra DSM 5091 TaxID=1122189 RepID=A0A1M6KFF1_MALRU|nr:hypothetical protein [Malonomonas rubra]SHJ57705.1 hypothetical protein SAMN02745165_02699 [Malonomonas rubra DSM 5091]